MFKERIILSQQHINIHKMHQYTYTSVNIVIQLRDRIARKCIENAYCCVQPALDWCLKYICVVNKIVHSFISTVIQHYKLTTNKFFKDTF